MSIQTEINRIKQSKENIISALESKGVTVPNDASIDDLSALVDAIEISSGTDTSDATATASDILSGKTAYVKGSKVTGNIATVTQPTPTISVSSAGKITASYTPSKGYTSSTTSRSATKQLTTKGATTYTPTTSNQTIASGTYLTGTQTIKGDSNLVASNIKSGVSIFGVSGSYSGTTPSGTLSITSNGTYDVTNYASASVNVPTGGGSSGGVNFETTTLTVEYISKYGTFYGISYPKIENESITYIDFYPGDENPDYMGGNIKFVLDDVVVGLPFMFDCPYINEPSYDNVEPQFLFYGACKITSSNPATITILDS